MEVKLSPELERKVREQVGGAYGSPTEVVEEALKSFFGPETLSPAEIDDLDRHIAMGLADVARGDVIDGPAALKAAIARLERRHRA
jgi:Arc/MetJ-type ribon-helix-helix transcriptional regulator